jgi:hypothetical protein
MAASDVTTLYLRGVPRHVVREAKAAAARDGKTLGRWVSEQLSQATAGDTAPSPGADALRADMAWFERNRVKLEREYARQYVAIVDQHVVDHDAEFDPLARRVFERFGVRSICMPKLDRNELRVRSPRRIRS